MSKRNSRAGIMGWLDRDRRAVVSIVGLNKDLGMTKEEREEAIAELNTFKIGAKSELGENALDIAIEALKQEPCGDCISRAEAMRAITDVWVRTHGKHTLEGFTDALYNLPAVIPEQPVMTGEWVTTRTQAESEENG